MASIFSAIEAAVLSVLAEGCIADSILIVDALGSRRLEVRNSDPVAATVRPIDFTDIVIAVFLARHFKS